MTLETENQVVIALQFVSAAHAYSTFEVTSQSTDGMHGLESVAQYHHIYKCTDPLML